MPNQDQFLQEITALKTKPVKELKAKFQKLFGEEKAVPENKAILVKKIAYKLQEMKYGELSPAAKEKTATLIKKYDPVNNKAVRPGKASQGDTGRVSAHRDSRLPIPGSIITKVYKGKKLEVKVLEKGFEYKGKTYRSLSGIAKDITGNGWNGFLFFGVGK
jgi:hypothetical protein